MTWKHLVALPVIALSALGLIQCTRDAGPAKEETPPSAEQLAAGAIVQALPLDQLQRPRRLNDADKALLGTYATRIVDAVGQAIGEDYTSQSLLRRAVAQEGRASSETCTEDCHGLGEDYHSAAVMIAIARSERTASSHDMRGVNVFNIQASLEREFAAGGVQRLDVMLERARQLDRSSYLNGPRAWPSGRARKRRSFSFWLHST